MGELATDTPVNIVGLLHAVNLNGKEAIIHSYNPTTERYGVVTSSDSETGYNVRRANLVDSEYAAERAGRAAAAERERAAAAMRAVAAECKSAAAAASGSSS